MDQAKLEQQQAAVQAAEAQAARADADRGRYRKSPRPSLLRKSELDLIKTEATSTAANVNVARSQAKAAAAQLAPDQADVEAASAQIHEAQAQVQQAELDLSYTKVAAPRSGRVTRRTVEPEGLTCKSGQSLLAIVPDEVWVVCQFQGNPVDTRYAPWSGPLPFVLTPILVANSRAGVDSLQGGRWRANSVCCRPENAVGNYVKVVQRVPVKNCV